MTNLIHIATVSVALSIPALAAAADNHDANQRQAAATAEAEMTCPLTEEVIAGIAELRAYGDRFQPVIDQIIIEAARPDWTWSIGCDQAVMLVQSNK